MKGLLIMSALNDFKELKQQVSFLGRSDSKTVWADAQEWKQKALTTVELVFKGREKAREVLEKIQNLFKTGFISSTGSGLLITEPDDEVERRFQHDICSAVGIMDECIKTLKMRYEEYSSDRECISDNTHEQMATNFGTDPASVVKEVAGPIIASRSALSHAASKALDAAMDAADSRFEGTKSW